VWDRRQREVEEGGWVGRSLKGGGGEGFQGRGGRHGRVMKGGGGEGSGSEGGG